MENINVLEVLRLGVIGLGFLLALLSYRLLGAEQKRENVRGNVLNSIYIFMFFSLFLSGLGLASEAIKRSDGASGENPVSTSGKTIDLSSRVVNVDAARRLANVVSQIDAISRSIGRDLPVYEPMMVSITSEDARYLIEACDEFENEGEPWAQAKDELGTMYPGLDKKSSCNWSLTGFTFQGWQDFLIYQNNIVLVMERLKDISASNTSSR